MDGCCSTKGVYKKNHRGSVDIGGIVVCGC